MNLLVYSLIVPVIASLVAPSLSPKKATHIVSLSFLVPFVVAFAGLFTMDKQNIILAELSRPIGDFYLLIDPISNAIGLTVCLVSAMVGYYSLPYMLHRFEEMGYGESEYRKYIIIYGFYAVSMLWLVYSGNFVLLYIFLEISLITSFLLIYLYGYGNRRWVAVLYFIWTNVAGVLTLIGFIIAGLDNSSFAIKDISFISFTAWLLIFIGMLIKLPGLGPHIWLPWAHAEAPTPVSALLSPLTVGLAGYILLRVYLIDPSFISTYRDIILVYAIISSIYAGFAVFKQTDYKRLLAYSTVSQMGYILIGLCLGTYGLIGVVIQYMSHAFGKSILFMGAGGIIAVYHGLRDLRKMGGLHEYVPSISNATLMGFMNLGGILTIGMFGEFFILRGIVDVFGSNLMSELPLIVAVVFIFILSGWYSFYTLKRVFYGLPKEMSRPKVSRYLDVPLYMIGILSILFIFPPLVTVLLNGLKAVIGGGI
ncbi:Formate hydrogenlyase subunit 3/Multisubunit Na+/H+ antiporter, MnhD subunit [Archaeoglobus sulfaticallidus PM70-1]|uniref:Formate hydrogenlyase subunit 3/Multisubunit Na+/H+ antiporter, MnhD subunit n=1 Tax=Archaeoglobus sulfaticallidus PM70-1 TaxID=387631 RepID=N0BN41_9EURY|nr:complex I subunit 5 family protein [Archaeoglobus sulfaticallidus]AGK61720.1 Formate hydrogenlyase subunit 3/Multisubunit Na+/H+ antiporter, MnhD subunit [Archaeoglobus sulfaticallidus PM70-1]